MSLLVTVYLEPIVAKVGGEKPLATVTEQLGACQHSYQGHLCATEKYVSVIKSHGAGCRMSRHPRMYEAER